jgi:hypothetical protein
LATRRVVRCWASAALLVVVAVLAAAVPAAASPPLFVAPADAPVVDGWDPPRTAFGPGNRGIDYGVGPGADVRAAGDGEVVFAGQVGGRLHVVVLHEGGIRTSYSFVEDVLVHRGQVLRQGDVLAHASGRFHFGARVGDEYIDPSTLFSAVARYHLAPLRDRKPYPLAREIGGLVAGLRGLTRAGSAAVAWAADVPGAVVGSAVDLVRGDAASLWNAIRLAEHYTDFGGWLLARAGAVRAYRVSQRGCTSPEEPPPPAPGRGRIVVLVAGLGSAVDGTGASPAILDVDTRSLGFADDHVAVFSYAGGQAPGARHLPGVPIRPYDRADSTGDIDAAAGRLRRLLESIRQHHPGVPVDLIAHSQGGLVARAALGESFDRFDPTIPTIEHLVTLGTPHRGAPLATAAAAVGTSASGQLALHGVDALTDGAVPAGSDAVADLGETSGFVRDLRSRPLPAGARVTSVAADGDRVVPAVGNALPGATNVLVPLRDGSVHDRLPGSAVAAREVALALADRAPTCRSTTGGLALSTVVDVEENAFGAVVGTAFQALDRWVGQTTSPRG